MALRPPVWRRVLSFPIVVLKKLSQVVGGYGFGHLANLFALLSNGCKVHVWWILLCAQRFVEGRPTWRFEDLAVNGIQPRTKRQRAAADADQRLLKVVCSCGEKDCKNRDGFYRVNPFPGLSAAEVEAKLRAMSRSLLNTAGADFVEVEVMRVEGALRERAESDARKSDDTATKE